MRHATRPEEREEAEARAGRWSVLGEVLLSALLGVSLFTVAPQIPDASPEASFTFAAVLVLFSIATTRCWIRVADLATDP